MHACAPPCRLTNERIRATIADVPSALDLLLALGWVKEEGEGGDGPALVIPTGKFMTMKEVGAWGGWEGGGSVGQGLGFRA